jgi:hypothetical protein
LPDAALQWGGDLSLTPAGDLALVDGNDLTRQRIERRLFTATRAYLWHPGYGAGLPQRIGRVARERVIAGIVRAQIGLEASVAKIPPPTIVVTQVPSNPGLFSIAITYTDAVTGVAVAIQLELPGSE